MLPEILSTLSAGLFAGAAIYVNLVEHAGSTGLCTWVLNPAVNERIRSSSSHRRSGPRLERYCPT
jgi:hypothetical protein